jgi:RNA polymerase sigma-70 factor (ECF subfamily)
LDVEAGEPGEKSTQLLRDFLSDEKSPAPEDVAVNRELCELVSTCLLELDEMHRTVITLRDIEGMSYAEMAQVLDTEIGTVRSRLSRARARLKALLEDILK